MARLAQAKVKRIAVFVKERRQNADIWVRRPYNIVEYDWGEGPKKTYMQPTGRRFSATLVDETYDDMRMYTETPKWDLCYPRRG